MQAVVQIVKRIKDFFSEWCSRVSRFIQSKLGITIVGATVGAILIISYAAYSKHEENEQLRTSTASFFINDIRNMQESMNRDFKSISTKPDKERYAQTSFTGLRFENYDANIKNIVYLNKDSKKAVMDLYFLLRKYNSVRTEMMIGGADLNLKLNSLKEVYQSAVDKSPGALKLLEKDSLRERSECQVYSRHDTE